MFTGEKVDYHFNTESIKKRKEKQEQEQQQNKTARWNHFKFKNRLTDEFSFDMNFNGNMKNENYKIAQVAFKPH